MYAPGEGGPLLRPAPPPPSPPPPRARTGNNEVGPPDVLETYAGEGVLLLREGGRRAAPPAERGGSEGELAPISTARLDLNALRSLDESGLLRGVLDVIVDLAAFEAAMLPEASAELVLPGASRGTSRHMARHLGAMLEWGVVERSLGRTRVVLPAFTVPKKSGGLRLVCDGRKLNRLMRPPPPMLLPSIHAVIARFLSSRAVVAADARSWFYQFPLAEGVRDFFGLHLAGARGPFVRARLRVLCMGWSWAPCIAHRAAMVLMPEQDGVSWVDNFFAVGQDEEDAARSFGRFMRRAETVGAELNVDESYGIPRQQFTALGLEFDLSATPQRYRSSPRWVEDFLASEGVHQVRSGDDSTARSFFRLFGGLVWFLHTTGRRLCFLPATLAFVRRAASRLGTTSDEWDTVLKVPLAVRRELAGVLECVLANDWVEAPPQLPEVVGWSDASDEEWAAVLEVVPEAVVQGSFPSGGHLHIFLKEVFAALQAVRLAARLSPEHELHLRVDNTAAVAAIQKGHSSCFHANRMLCSLYDEADRARLAVRCSWVPTGNQRADEFTRGRRASPCGVSLPPFMW